VSDLCVKHDSTYLDDEVELNELRVVHLKTLILKDHKSCLLNNVTVDTKVKLQTQLEKDIILEKSCVFSN